MSWNCFSGLNRMPGTLAAVCSLLFVCMTIECAAITTNEFVVSATEPRQPRGITYGPDGAYWFTEFNGNRIGRIATNGVIKEFSIPTANSQPFDIVTGPDNN